MKEEEEFKIPNGLDAIIATYGDPFVYVNDKDSWQAEKLVRLELWHPLPYAYDMSISVTHITAHRMAGELMCEALTQCIEKGVEPRRLAYGGCYSWRAKRRSSNELSTHTWGIAIDLDPINNPMLRPWDQKHGMPETVVRVFEDLGFTWGGRWGTPDTMHFQLATGY